MLQNIRKEATRFLENELKLEINLKSDKIINTSHGLRFLGVQIYPNGRTLNKRNIKRIKTRLNLTNVSSYHGLIKKHGNLKGGKCLNWIIYEKLIDK